MEQNLLIKPEIKLVGISCRTSYQEELDKMNGHIFPCIKRYFHDALCDQILHRKNPGTTFCVYTDYESDYKGAYTYFIGEEVSSFASHLEEGFHQLTIPKQNYAKFTTGPGSMPDVLVNAWTKIWTMPSEELGGTRSYHTDFEVYDERASDHQKLVFDIYVGISP